MSDRTPLLVLGLGNVLLGDDGAGAGAVERLLSQYDIPDGVKVYDGGTLGLSLLPYIEQADQVILLDAVSADAPAGSIVRVSGDDVSPVVATRLSPHQFGVSDLLDGARWLGRYPRTVLLLGVVPASIELRVGLSPHVAAAIPDLVAFACDECASMGYPLQPKAEAVAHHA